MPTTSQGGWSIAYETLGDRSNPPILLTLGLSHRMKHWGTLPGLLAERLFVVTFDCRGMGASEQRDEPFTVADETADMVAVLDAAGVEAAHIYGRSRGGMLAQEFALSYPQRTMSLILSGTSHRGPGAVGSTERVQRAMNITPDMTREQIFAGQDEAMASPGWRERDPQAFEYCLAADLEAPPRRFAVVRQQGATADWSSYERLPWLHAPTLVLCGEDDGMVPPDNSRDIALRIPNSKLVLIPQCGHLPMLEKPGELATEVFAFIDRLS